MHGEHPRESVIYYQLNITCVGIRLERVVECCKMSFSGADPGFQKRGLLINILEAGEGSEAEPQLLTLLLLYHAHNIHNVIIHLLQYFDDLSCSHSHILHVLVYIVPTMLTELLYPLQDGDTPLHLALRGHTTCVERLLSIPGIDVNIKRRVSW